MEHFIQTVETYLKDTGTRPSALGRKALGDPAFVFELRNGRDVRLGVVERVMAAMIAHPEGM